MKYLLILLICSGCASQTITRIKTTQVDSSANQEIKVLREALSLPRYWNFSTLKQKQRFDSLMRLLPYKTEYKIKYPN